METIAGVGGRYSFKVWETGQPEPPAWDIVGQEALSDPQNGSMMLISHHADASYGDVAQEVGLPAQAVGQACGANRIPILIPCHRILGANGLGGFSAPGGVETKVWLLRHEGAAGLLI